MADHHDAHDHQQAVLSELPPVDPAFVRKVAVLMLAAGGIGFVASGLANGSLAEPGGTSRDFFMAYLCGFVYWASLPFGALGLLMIGYLTQASWGVVLRRLFQAATRTLPVLALLFVPVAVGLFVDKEHSPYWWTHPAWHLDHHDKAAVAARATELGMPPAAVAENAHKVHDYLNAPFFILRTAVYFLLGGLLANRLNAWGQRFEDTGDERAWGKLRNLAGPGVIAWVLAMTFAATDWVMSVEPTWASSMFPVVYGMNMFVITWAVCVSLFYTLNADKPGVMLVLKEKFRIDMASLMLAMTLVWAYATFCQYMLIWAGNLPEEVTYFRKRGDHGWQYLAYFLMAFHWVIPFFCITMREFKTNPKAIRVICVILLAACAGDVVWWVLPSVPRPGGGLHVVMALSAIAGVGGVWGLAFARELAKRPILPANRVSSWPPGASTTERPFSRRAVVARRRGRLVFRKGRVMAVVGGEGADPKKVVVVSLTGASHSEHDTDVPGAERDSVRAGHEPDKFQVKSILAVPALLAAIVLIAFGIVTAVFVTQYTRFTPAPAGGTNPQAVEVNTKATADGTGRADRDVSDRFARIGSTAPKDVEGLPGTAVPQPRLEYLKQTEPETKDDLNYE